MLFIQNSECEKSMPKFYLICNLKLMYYFDFNMENGIFQAKQRKQMCAPHKKMQSAIFCDRQLENELKANGDEF